VAHNTLQHKSWIIRIYSNNTINNKKKLGCQKCDGKDTKNSNWLEVVKGEVANVFRCQEYMTCDLIGALIDERNSS
jgi:hypothetical protein